MAEGTVWDWRRENYPLAMLPEEVRDEIGKYLDASPGETGFMTFASRFGFRRLDASAIFARTKYSATIDLLAELERRTPATSIQDIYRVLIQMRSAAADVIASNMPYILRRSREGQQNTEPSFCPSCDLQRDQSQPSGNFYPRRPNRAENESDDHTLYPEDFTRNTRSFRASYTQTGHPVPHHLESQPSIEPLSQQDFINPARNRASINGAVEHPLQRQNQNGSATQSKAKRDQFYDETGSDRLEQHSSSVSQTSFPWYPPDPSTGRYESRLPLDLDQHCLRSFPVTINPSGQHSENVYNSMTPVASELRRSANSNIPSRGDSNTVACQKCRLASDCEETIVFTPVSEPKHSCALHSESANNSVISNSESSSGIKTQNSQNGGYDQAEDEIFHNGNRRVVGSSEVYAHENSSNNSCQKLKVDGETVPKTVNSQKNEVLTRVFEDQDETHLKTRCINNDADKFERLKCPMCSLNMDQSKTAVKSRFINKDIKKFEQSKCSKCSYTHTKEVARNLDSYSSCEGNCLCSCNRNMASVNPDPNCSQCQKEFEHNMNELKTTTQSQVIYERHSWHEGTKHDSRISLASSSSDSSIVSQASSLSLYTRSESGSKPVVLVTYSLSDNREKNDQHVEEVMDLIRKTKDTQISVRVDMDQVSFAQKRWNRLDWLDKNLRKANYVIVCISPEYKQDIIPKDGAVPQESQLNTRYIYDHIRAEYYENQCRNYRVIPILFPNSGAKYCHIPKWMTATSVYTYPKDVATITKLIRNS